MPKRTRDFHTWLLDRLGEPREAEKYLKVAMADSKEVFLNALRNVAEAHQMAKVAASAGVNRENLYRTLSEEGNPRLSTLESILNAIGMNLTVSLKQPPGPSAAAAGLNAGGIIATPSTAIGLVGQLKPQNPSGYISNTGAPTPTVQLVGGKPTKLGVAA